MHLWASLHHHSRVKNKNKNTTFNFNKLSDMFIMVDNTVVQDDGTGARPRRENRSLHLMVGKTSVTQKKHTMSLTI